MLQVLSNVASRLAVMHEAGYVHRDLKPANVMWLPRENRWIVIDFGCVARIGDAVPLSFTLAYASPEVVQAHEVGIARMEAWPALDAWSLGVMAFELLTGAPAFKFLTEGRAKVCIPRVSVALCGVALYLSEGRFHGRRFSQMISCLSQPTWFWISIALWVIPPAISCSWASAMWAQTSDILDVLRSEGLGHSMYKIFGASAFPAWE